LALLFSRTGTKLLPGCSMNVRFDVCQAYPENLHIVLH